MARVTFTTREFERSHCRKPSRTAMGTWAFCFDRDDTPWFASTSRTFSEAKREAKAEAERRGACEVRVQP